MGISPLLMAETLIPFSTKDLPKAKGLDITIKYPSDWRQEDASRLNVITKFTKKYSGENLGMMMLGVYDLEPSVFKALNNGSTDVWRQLNSANNIKVLNIIKTKKEGRDIYFSETKNTFAGPEFTITMRYKEMQLLYKEKLLTLTCGIIVRNSPADNELDQSLNKVVKECEQFFDSLVLTK
jgi:hypothetical protein